jgi:KDO2-lipid IV(A) lauroyltransferase
MLTRIGILCMRVVAPLPLPLLRGMGAVLGLLLYLLAVPRRRVTSANLKLCFPHLSMARRQMLALRVFVRFAQAWLDRSWLWHGDPACALRRLRITGAVDELSGNWPLVLFAPHFVGLDAGWTALNLQGRRSFSSIYTRQRNRVVDQWIHQGRRRFGAPLLFERREGAKTIVSSLRRGQALYLLPDMNFGPQESVFVPFYGVATATLTSLARFARLGQARVVPAVCRMTRSGYTVHIHPAWADFPSADLIADTARMNRHLQDYIDTMPEQYYWVHRRFKTRPPGAPSVY